MSKPSRARAARDEGVVVAPAAATLGHLEDCWDEPGPGCKMADLERLQGAWTAVDGRRKAAFLLSGNRFAIHFANGDIYMGSFVLGPAGRLRTMDVRIEEGPAQHRGQTALCIYEVKGDVLRWCTAGPGRSDRPPAFPDGTDSQYLCLVFHREPKGGSHQG